MSFENYKNLWVLIETEENTAKNVGYELLNAGPVSWPTNWAKSWSLWSSAARWKMWQKKAIAYGADKAILVEGDEYYQYSSDACTYALAELINKYQPSSVLIGATNNGRDVAPRVAAKIGTGLTADCTELGIDEETGNIAWTRPAFGGNLMAKILCPDNRPQMGTVRPGVFKKSMPDDGRTGEIVREDIHIDPANIRVHLLERVKEVAQAVNLEEAEIIVAGGRGVKSAEGFAAIQKLADALGCTVGASRGSG